MKETISKKQLRQFGIIVGLAIPVIMGWFVPFIWGYPFKVWTFWIGCTLLILGLIKPTLLFYPYKAWIGIGNILGWINSRIILGLIFILVLQPIAFIMRLFGYDPLKQNFKGKTTDSYRELRRNKVDLTRIF